MALVYLTVAWCVGIWLAHQCWTIGLISCETPGWAFVMVAMCSAGLAVLWRREPSRRWPAVLLAFALLGAWRYQQRPFVVCPAATTLATYNGSVAAPTRAVIEGVIVGYPDVRDTRTLYHVRADTLILGGQARPVQGDVRVEAPRYPAFAYGDRVRASGQLITPPSFDDFDYAAYLSIRGIHSLLRRARLELISSHHGHPLWAALYRLRGRGALLLNRILPEPMAALANGMLLGIESGIPDAVDEAFKVTGTAHVIVISGSNIALLTGVLMALLGRGLGRHRAPFLVAVVVMLYVLLVGADPPALRAGIMGILYVIAIALGRVSTAYVSLCASALVMAWLNPLALWDVGFQLSFAATLGLILFTTPLQVRCERLLGRYLPIERSRQATALLNDTLIVTLAAQVLTLPLLVYYFGRLSPVSLVANFMILPAQPPIMVGGMATLVVGLIWEVFGRVVAVIPWLFLAYTVAVVRGLAAVPLASVETGALGRLLATLYGVGLVVVLAWRHRPQLRRMIPVPLAAGRWLVAAGVSGWLILTAVNQLPDGRLHLMFISNTAGEAVLLTTPSGRRIWLWDGRGDGAALAAAARRQMGGGRPGVVLAFGPDVRAYWPAAQAVEPAQMSAGSRVRLDQGVELAQLTTRPAWLVRYGRFRTIVPATLSPETQDELARSAAADLALTVLKAPGVGTGTWPTTTFLDVVSPQVVLWPEDVTYPSDVTAWLSDRRAARIPSDGVVEVITDGTWLWLRRLNDAAQR